jgi:hypothetical protein
MNICIVKLVILCLHFQGENAFIFKMKMQKIQVLLGALPPGHPTHRAWTAPKPLADYNLPLFHFKNMARMN